MKKVLIVDDSATVRKQLIAAFEPSSDYELIEAENGVDALGKLDANPDVKLLISDINMPEMDGITLIKNIFEGGKFSSLPILMVTTEAGADLKAQAKQYGVRAWIIKPFSNEKILMAAEHLTK